MGTFLALLAPFEYLLIRHSLKRAVDIYAPLSFAIVAAIGACWGALNMFGSAGLVPGVNGLLQIVAGFFITSLAAIATFNGAIYRIDDPFEGEAAILHGEALTRRQFLCHLFAYLAIVSVVLYLAGVIGIASAGYMHMEVVGVSRLALRSIFLAGYAAIFGHVLGTTLIGLIFLSSRFSRVSPRDRFTARPKNGTAPAPQSAREAWEANLPTAPPPKASPPPICHAAPIPH
jgi:hypothetical protein